VHEVAPEQVADAFRDRPRLLEIRHRILDVTKPALYYRAVQRQPWGQSIALRVQSEIWLSSLPQQLDAAEAAVRAAIDIQVARECRCDLAWSRLVLGRVLQAKGNSAAALAELVEAKREFEQLDIARGIEIVSAALEIASESAHVKEA
jgi:hypothetical protein